MRGGSLIMKNRDSIGVVLFRITGLFCALSTLGCDAAAGPVPRTFLVPDDLPVIANFGQSVAISGDVLVVGAPGDDHAGGNSGAVYVFSKSMTGDWVFRQKIVADDASAGTSFGASVATDGETIFVGAPFHAQAGANSGAVYVFERVTATQWQQSARLVGMDTVGQDRFGASVAATDGAILIGAPGHDFFAGAAYVFEGNTPGPWVQSQKVTGDNGGGFGNAVALDGDRLIVGAVGELSAVGPLTGAAHVFRRNGGQSWTLEAKLIPDDIATLDRFGASVSIRNDLIAVGTVCEVSEVNPCEAAYVFRREANQTWTQEARLALANPGFDRFGESIAVGCNFVAVGAPADDALCGGGVGCDAGAIYLFQGVGNAWTLVNTILASSAGDRMGASVAIHADSVLAGVPGDDQFCRAMPICNSGSSVIVENLAPGLDCNGNGVSDVCDIADGTSADANMDSEPDECSVSVPAASQWGTVGLMLLVLIFGTLLWARTERVALPGN